MLTSASSFSPSGDQPIKRMPFPPLVLEYTALNFRPGPDATTIVVVFSQDPSLRTTLTSAYARNPFGDSMIGVRADRAVGGVQVLPVQVVQLRYGVSVAEASGCVLVTWADGETPRINASTIGGITRESPHAIVSLAGREESRISARLSSICYLTRNTQQL
jgi:hypothetical protein